MGVVNEEFDEIPDEIFEVAGCGFGCVLMKRNVLWNVLCQHGYMFSPINTVGEDLSFCWRARQCGYKIYCDPTIALGHEIRTIITKSNRGIFNGNAFKTQT
jgi:GT2 family glycosyltransferase